MTDRADIGWATCSEDGCMGVRLATTSECLAHADDEQRNATLNQLGETGEIDARGVPFTSRLLDDILLAAPQSFEPYRPTFTAARFERATFQDAGFSRSRFLGDVSFSNATFLGPAVFSGATFRGEVSFGGATFQGFAMFSKATFQSDAWFGGATFQSDAWFSEARFQADAGFYKATFQADAGFRGATFGVSRTRRTTRGYIGFVGAVFERGAWFIDTIFEGEARFAQVTFKEAQQVGPLLAYRGLRMDDAEFVQPVQIEASTIGMCCRRVRFRGGVQLRLRWARVLLDNADLAEPSIIAGIPRLTSDRQAALHTPLPDQEQRFSKAWQRLLGGAVSEQPRLLSLQGANVAGLGLVSVDLADCRFAGAYNLDQLRLEADVSFASAPVWLGWDWRQAIAEERAWRAHRTDRWPKPIWPAWAGEEPAVPKAGQIAGLYRALRKSREDAKDEPGAADFYYGEMEMRRHARPGHTGGASRGLVERTVLTAYWLVSGYGLRAWRALATLTIVLVAFAGLQVWIGGYHPTTPSQDDRTASTSTTRAPAESVAATTTAPTPEEANSTSALDRWVEALLYGARTIIGLNPTPPPDLNRVGEVLLIVVRVLGPLLLGLAVLALRGRVKR